MNKYNYKCIFMVWYIQISTKITLRLIPMDPIENE